MPRTDFDCAEKCLDSIGPDGRDDKRLSHFEFSLEGEIEEGWTPSLHFIRSVASLTDERARGMKIPPIFQTLEPPLD